MCAISHSPASRKVLGSRDCTRRGPYGGHMRRRKFIKLIGGAAMAWPLAARAQQPVKPVVGILRRLSINDQPRIARAFQLGLKEVGYVEGRNVAIEYRFAEGEYDRLPALAADLVSRRVAVINAISGTPAALAAKAATSTIPIVFANGGDPVSSGLVTNINRPGGNVTGVTFFTAPLAAKRLDLLRRLAPKAATVGVLINAKNPPSGLEAQNVTTAAIEFGLPTKVLGASTASEIDEAFATIVQEQIGTLYVSADP